jgi:hypothetical protein
VVLSDQIKKERLQILKESLKYGGIKTTVKGDLTAILWKDIGNVNMLTNKHRAPIEGHFCYDYGNNVKPGIVQDCKRYGLHRWEWPHDMQLLH